MDIRLTAIVVCFVSSTVHDAGGDQWQSARPPRIHSKRKNAIRCKSTGWGKGLELGLWGLWRLLSVWGTYIVPPAR